MRLLLASQNQKKLRELGAILSGLDVEVLTPDAIGGLPDVVEDELTFRGNAAKKARAAALHTGLWVLADDSGLEVEALNGAPGVRSARFAGDARRRRGETTSGCWPSSSTCPTTDATRASCARWPSRAPTARSRSRSRARAHGRILRAPRGTHDFGYDPLFLFTEPGFPQTNRGFAELDASEKAAVSHRGRALRQLAADLSRVLSASTRST
jgi:XTP/dITP diphosphohydrolase